MSDASPPPPALLSLARQRISEDAANRSQDKRHPIWKWLFGERCQRERLVCVVVKEFAAYDLDKRLCLGDAVRGWLVTPARIEPLNIESSAESESDTLSVIKAHMIDFAFANKEGQRVVLVIELGLNGCITRAIYSMPDGLSSGALGHVVGGITPEPPEQDNQTG